MPQLGGYATEIAAKRQVSYIASIHGSSPIRRFERAVRDGGDGGAYARVGNVGRAGVGGG